MMATTTSNFGLPLMAAVLLASLVYQNQVVLLQQVHSIWEWYRIQLDLHPVWTKSITTSLIQFMGDFMAQCYENFRKQSNNRDRDIELYRGILGGYDFRRGMSLAADGMFLSGPLLHHAYELMEHMLPTEDNDAAGFIFGMSVSTILHVLTNDFLMDTIYLALSFVFVALAEGLWQDLPDLFKNDFLAILQASWGTSILLLPVEYFCFSKVPLTLRVLFMNFVDIFWGAIISFVTHRNRIPPSA